MTLYEELELQPNCSFDDIKQQYRTLASIHHPDKGGDEERFKRIKFAYEVLSDPVRRKQYDETKTTNIADDIHKEAINTLANIFFSIIPNFDCNNGNLVNVMKDEVNRLKVSALADLAKNETYIKNLEVVKSKLKTKNPNDENIIMAFVEKQLETRNNDRKLFEHRIKLSEEMMLVMENHDYGFVELINEIPVVMENETRTQ